MMSLLDGFLVAGCLASLVAGVGNLLFPKAFRGWHDWGGRKVESVTTRGFGLAAIGVGALGLFGVYAVGSG